MYLTLDSAPRAPHPHTSCIPTPSGVSCLCHPTTEACRPPSRAARCLGCPLSAYHPHRGLSGGLASAMHSTIVNTARPTWGHATCLQPSRGTADPAPRAALPSVSKPQTPVLCCFLPGAPAGLTLGNPTCRCSWVHSCTCCPRDAGRGPKPTKGRPAPMLTDKEEGWLGEVAPDVGGWAYLPGPGAASPGG